MKGIINKGIQELVENKFGLEAWERIKEKARCNEPFFSAGEDYPDQMTFDLAAAASELSGLPMDTVLEEFGKFWILHTGSKSYPSYFNLAGRTAREFLLNMDKVHRQVMKNLSNARPPTFSYEELPDGHLLMRYRSERNLCAVLRGLILGVGTYFQEELQVRETSCVNRGDPECTMEILFP